MYLSGAVYGSAGAGGIIAIVPTSCDEVSTWNNRARRHGSDYRRWKQRMTERLVRHIKSSCADLGDLDPVELATPLTLQDYSQAPQGAIYGVGRFLGQYNPQPQTRLPGLYLSGQAIGGPGLLGTVVAGYYTCGTMMDHDSLRGELRACR